MSIKRQASTDLNHENWDQDDPSEHEEMGSFKSASKDVLEKRVIRTAKRRSHVSDDEAKKSVFSGFGGFNKVQPSSFDFLANLTNGNKSINASPVNKSDTAVTSSLFGSQPVSSSPGGTFNNTTTKLTFGQASSPTSGLFKGSSANTPIGQSLFTASKADSTVGDSPFKIQDTSNSADATSRDSSKTTAANIASPPQVSSSIFGTHSIGANTNKSLFSASTNNSMPFKIQPVTSTSSPVVNSLSMKSNIATVNDSDDKKYDEEEDNKINYYTKLRGLNESVSKWIKKHVDQSPVCILSPIFIDYEKHLKDIQDEYEAIKEKTAKNAESNKSLETTSSPTNVIKKEFSSNDEGTSLFSKTGSTNPKPSVFDNKKTSMFGNQSSSPTLDDKSQNFSFGINKTTNSYSGMNPNSSGGFQFVSNPSAQTTVAAAVVSPFSSTTTANATAPFSFGIGRPFSFSPNIQRNTEPTKNDDKEEEDEPPKVEFTPVVEENSVHEKRCKIFVKKDGNFADKGVGTLYIKKVEESGKYQLLTRANTNLGNVLLNLILTPSIVTQRLGKNNVMMVCIPTPDAKPPPTPVLIRVKTSDEADELLNTLNKYKM